MQVKTDRLVDWLRSARRLNGLHLDVMTQAFDLDGGLSAGQLELAWRARQEVLILSAELFLRENGVPYLESYDVVEHTSSVLEALEGVSGDRAAEVWEMRLRAAPTDAAELVADIRRTLDFCGERLGVTSVGSRGATIRAWADSLRLLREVAQDLGVAQSEQWYLRDESAAADHLDWYDEVMAVVEAEAVGGDAARRLGADSAER
ncbi:hypothetical protein KBX50_17080 [Micromonospora sp. C51]|uniref:hypothetical protein n=1 Tax=Micromonospora sp. C51 TaxID=2824879 RepID=UPI001B378931|nr:hypothetical protein [Micromonospora sp. C51]MBQ1050175.1 hypothetical protein [Micromonospora sp. C51]